MSTGQTWPYILNLGNSIIGVAVLAMPYCFKQCGIILGIVLLLFCTWLTLVSCQLLMKAAVISRKRSFEYLAYYTFGAAGKFVIEICMIGLQLGTLIAQIVVIGDLGPGIMSKVFGFENTPNLRMVLIVFLCLCVGLPLGLLKDLRSVSRASTLCICFYTVFVMYVLLLSVPNLWTGQWYPKVAFWKPEGVFQTLPIFSLSFGCQTQLFLLYDSMPEPSLKSVNGVINTAVNLCTVAYLLVGFFGYIAFYENDVTGDIINHFPQTFAADIIKLCFVVAIAVTFPLIIFPCRASLYTLLFPQKPKYEDIEDSHMPELHFKFITVAIVVGSMIIGIMVPNVEFILGMNGATMGTLICYIFPALFFVRVMANKAEGKHIAQLVMILGITILLVSTFATLYTQDKAHTHPVAPKALENVDNIPKEDPFKPADSLVDKVAIVESKDEKRVEPPVPDAPIDIPKVDSVEKKNEELPKKDGSEDAKSPDKDEVAMKKDDTKEKPADTKVDDKAKEDDVKDEKRSNDELDLQKEKIEEVEAKEEDLKEREKKIEENEQKQQVLLEKLVEQQEEQKQLINEQKQLLQELKDHKDTEHTDDEDGAAQGLQPPAQGVQQGALGIQQPLQGLQPPNQPVQSAQQGAQGVQQPLQRAQRAQLPVQGAQQGLQQPVQGVQQSVQGVQQPQQNIVLQQPAQGLQQQPVQPVQQVNQPNQAVQQPAKGLQQPAQGLQQPAQGLQQPAQGLQQPAQGGQVPVQGILQQNPVQQPVQNVQGLQGIQQPVQQVQGLQGVQQPVQNLQGLQQPVQPLQQQQQQQQQQQGNALANNLPLVNQPVTNQPRNVQGQQGVVAQPVLQQSLGQGQVVQQQFVQNQKPLSGKAGLKHKRHDTDIKQKAKGMGNQFADLDKLGKKADTVLDPPEEINAGMNAGVGDMQKVGLGLDDTGLNRQKRELNDRDLKDVLKEVADLEISDRVAGAAVHQASKRR